MSAQVNPLLMAIALGFVLGIFGHIIRARTLIVLGIVIIGAGSAYFAFVLQPGS